MKSFNIFRLLGRIRIGRRLGLGFGLILVLMLALIALVEYRMSQIEQHTEDVFKENVGALGYLERMSDSVYIVANATRSLLLLKSDAEVVAAEREKIVGALDQYDGAFKAVAALDTSPDVQAILRSMSEERSKFGAINQRVLSLLDQKNADEAAAILGKEQMPVEEAWQEQIDTFALMQHKQSEAAKADIDRQLSASKKFNVGTGAVLVALAATLAFVIARSITSPIGELQRAIQRVQDGGTLDALATIETRDEMADMGVAVNLLLQEQIAARDKIEAERRQAEAENERLNNSVIAILQAVHQLSQRDLTVRVAVTEDIIGTVSDSINQLTDETVKVLMDVHRIAGQVAEGSSNVRSQAQLVSTTADAERKRVGQMIDSLNDTTQSINQVAAMVEQSNTSAVQATQVTDLALDTVTAAVKGMEAIRETIAETEKRIKRLGERSQEISGIVNLINTISERTHVLALNASMQAAVAGEAGRGFAVVAEEVQRLAESSRNATQQIATLVSNIQIETNETISTVNRTIGQVVQGSEQAQKAGDQMRRTQQFTAELVAQIQRIAEASSEQRAKSGALLSSVQIMGESADRTALQIEAQNQETESLLASARRLVDSVSVFKLPKSV
ncbi:MAG: MCP four helix bundle domain-containing protein [Burkholderiales bacterium]|nr:MCP four helix bundle domain-containing protein [Burkholderiales bacterium]